MSKKLIEYPEIECVISPDGYCGHTCGAPPHINCIESVTPKVLKDGRVEHTPGKGCLGAGMHIIIPAPVCDAADAVITAAGNLADSYIQGFGEMGVLKDAVAKYREVSKDDKR